MTLIEVEQARPRTGGKDGALRDWVRALEATAPIAANPQRILPRVIEEFAETCGDAPALLSAGERLTYRALDDRINRYARWALEQNLGKGETVCLVMPNRPEYMAIWLGITKVGGVVSLINTNLRGSALTHCLDIVKPKHIIVAAELCDGVRAALTPMASRPKIWSHGERRFCPHRSCHREIARRTANRDGTPRRDYRRPRAPYLHLRHHRPAEGRQCQPPPADAMELLVRRHHGYRPRRSHVRLPADVSQRRRRRCHRRGAGARRLGGDPRQLLRSANSGTTSSIGTARCSSISASCAAIWSMRRSSRAKSSTAFDCAAATGCAPMSGRNSRTAFAIPQILEFYAATEGNVSLYNVEGKAGAIGRVPSFLAHRFPLALVKFDPATQRADRATRAGFCIRCATGEVGEAIGRILDGAAHAAADSRAIPTPRHRRKKSFATCSSAATPGTAPAI